MYTVTKGIPEGYLVDGEVQRNTVETHIDVSLVVTPTGDIFSRYRFARGAQEIRAALLALDFIECSGRVVLKILAGKPTIDGEFTVWDVASDTILDEILDELTLKAGNLAKEFPTSTCEIHFELVWKLKQE